MSDRRYVCRASDPQWLSERKKVVTGSEIGIVMGVSPWKTRDQLLEEKRAPDKPIVSRHMWWGSHSEKSNMEAFSKLTGLKTRPTNRFWVRGPLGATIDGFVYAVGRVPYLDPCWTDGYRQTLVRVVDLAPDAGYLGLIEMKQTESYRAKEWAKGVPPYYAFQAQAQMHVLGIDWCVVACRLGAADMVCHVLEVDKDLGRAMVNEARDFLSELYG